MFVTFFACPAGKAKLSPLPLNPLKGTLSFLTTEIVFHSKRAGNKKAASGF